MGYVTLIAPCLVCKVPFMCNPQTVPSHPARNGEPVMAADDPHAPKEPICRSCISRINVERRALGLATWTILEGAYDAVADEGVVM